MNRVVVIFTGALLMAAATAQAAGLSAQKVPEGKKMELSSPAFKHQEPIPEMYTCHGSNVNPELVIANVPEKTKSLALIVDDPDAPEGTWVHWVIYDIPPKTQKIEKNSKVGIEGLSDLGTFNYRGPCPANNRVHRYSFRIYALSERLELNEGFIKSDLERKMRGKILEQAELIGTYKNPDKYNE
jgi:Raf kinase inhibitor-like YbhB/YbcL family protein